MPQFSLITLDQHLDVVLKVIGILAAVFSFVGGVWGISVWINRRAAKIAALASVIGKLEEKMGTIESKMDHRLAAQDAAIDDMKENCGVHMRETTATSTVLTALKEQFVGQLGRMHDRIDEIGRMQHNMSLALATGDFKLLMEELKTPTYNKKPKEEPS